MGYKILNEEVKINHFPDNTLLLKTYDIDFDAPIHIKWHYENDAELFAIICLAKKAKGDKYLDMPYCPHARQDRVKGEEDTFTLKYFTEVINSLGFDEVTILDPHSPVSEALIDNVFIESPQKYIENIIYAIEQDGSELILFFPDAGASKRYASMFPEYKYIYGNKIRTWETGEIVGTEIVNPFNVDLKDKTILMIDDICSKGTTFFKSAEALQSYNVGDIYLWVTHCENTILEGQVLTSGLIKTVFTTNSIFTKEHEKIKVLDLNQLKNKEKL
jgi:ribose-phosphate pyrophosphokinase